MTDGTTDILGFDDGAADGFIEGGAEESSSTAQVPLIPPMQIKLP